MSLGDHLGAGDQIQVSHRQGKHPTGALLLESLRKMLGVWAFIQNGDGVGLVGATIRRTGLANGSSIIESAVWSHEGLLFWGVYLALSLILSCPALAPIPSLVVAVVVIGGAYLAVVCGVLSHTSLWHWVSGDSVCSIWGSVGGHGNDLLLRGPQPTS